MSESMYLWCEISNVHADRPKQSSHWHKYVC